MKDYDGDILAWSEQQSALLRRRAAGERVNDTDLDWPNIAEEIESVGRSERAALSSHIANIIEHLIKLETSPAVEPRAGWEETILRARSEVEQLLEDSPSLRPSLGAAIARQLPRARRLAAAALRLHGEEPRTDIRSLTYDEAQVLGEWLPAVNDG
jgi:hypothetical protein